MKQKGTKRLLSLLLVCLCLLPYLPVTAADTDPFHCEKTAEAQPDGTVRITLQAYQTGRVAAADIVLVLDVSGSMEHNSVVPADQVDGSKTYYIDYAHPILIDGQQYIKHDYVPVRNTAAAGDTPTWFAEIPDSETPLAVDPAETPFYTGAMESLREAASQFAQSIADNAAEYDAPHRIAVVEFSSSEKKNDDALCTHDNPAHVPFYANILTGGGRADKALLSARDNAADLQAVFTSLRADGATYSDDALTQAQRILAASSAAERVVILFTDGGPGSYGWEFDTDNSALPTANNAIATAKAMKAQGVKIYTVGVFNEGNLSGDVGKKNEAYLNRISSNYPTAGAMDDEAEKTADTYCAIGETGMNLNAAFSAISSVIGTPVHSARVQDTIAGSFLLTDAQKRSLLQAYPDVQIAEQADGTTAVLLDDVDFPTVAVRADGSPVDPDDTGIFTMTFDVTPHEEFLGGQAVQTNTGACGVFTGDMCLASFPVPQVDVPLRASALPLLLQTKDVTLYAGHALQPQDFYVDLSGSAAAAGADSVTYTVTDDAGAPFTGGVPTQSGTYTVTMTVRMGQDTASYSRSVPLTVQPNPVVSIDAGFAAGKTEHFVGDAVSADDFTVTAHKADGSTFAVGAADLTVSPAVLDAPGQQTITVTYGDVRQNVTVLVQAVKAVKATVIAYPDNRSFVYRRTPDFTGLAVAITYNNGSTEVVRDLSQMTILPNNSLRVRRGSQEFIVTVQHVSAVFTMQPRLVWWQWLILILLFGWIWY